ncbi:pseudouridylate synthase 7 homolog [Leptidea sinapis]|uniref:pseudouridylate synthase 7 homolog n=1 Tax=Leptidea sinapis TaxID=189913 RepID=UPI00213A3DDF|nr:pseudouridylate synthase 7 homolog [Leptidea sinapis]
MLGYAGTKDRRAKTSQWFSLRKVDPRKIVNACKDLPSVKIGNFSFSSVHLKLGMLKGNRFRICLRNVTGDPELVDRACCSLRDNGFLNYYGLQRFGANTSAPTSTVGKLLLQGNYEQAIRCILSERAGPLERVLCAYQRHGASAALRMIPGGPHDRHTPELRLLRALADGPQHLTHALDQIPRNTRLLYVHSYQSLVWNGAASERVRRHGLRPAPGDLVLAEPRTPADTIEPIDETVSDEQEGDAEEVETETQGDEDNQESAETTKMVAVKVVTQEDVESDRYTIFDVVLPLPGHSVRYPPNMVDFYQEMLTKDGLTLEMKHKHKGYHLGGGYRHVAVRPGEVTWRLVRYHQPTADLLLSDRDQLEGVTATGDQTDGKYSALLLTLSLPPSCYATMALRELLKMDTSSSTQAKLNDYHKDCGGQELTEPGQTDARAGDDDKRKIQDGGEDECSGEKKSKISDD